MAYIRGRRALQKHAVAVQTDEHQAYLCSTQFWVDISIGQFGRSNNWFLKIDPQEEGPGITPGKMLHITFAGETDWNRTELMDLVAGEYALTFAKKWSPDKKATAYIIDGEVLELCEKVALLTGLGPHFNEWHVSL